jgi:hypothetical protein
MFLASCLATGLVAGCQSVDPEYSTLGGGGDRVNSAGVHQLLGPEFERLDLIQLLGVPQRSVEAQQAQQDCKTSSDARPSHSEEYRMGCLIDDAFSRYHTDSALDTEARRNSIQDRILSASDQRCNVFLIYIHRHEAATSFWLGSLTTLLAGAGAIATGVDAARTLAGSAGIVSGVRAEYSQSYLENQTTSIISKGISQRRKAIKDEIDARRHDPLTSYTIERAVGDAMRYHGSCSIIAGLEETDTTLSKSAGLDMLAAELQTAAQLGRFTNQAVPKPPLPAASGPQTSPGH